MPRHTFAKYAAALTLTAIIAGCSSNAPVDVDKLRIGDTVPAVQIAEARSAGANVYRTIDGDGHVVKFGTLPKIIAHDYREAFAGNSATSRTLRDSVGAEARHAGVSMASVHDLGGGRYRVTVMVNGMPNMDLTQTIPDGKDAAIKVAKAHAKQLGLDFLDLT